MIAAHDEQGQTLAQPGRHVWDRYGCLSDVSVLFVNPVSYLLRHDWSALAARQIQPE